MCLYTQSEVMIMASEALAYEAGVSEKAPEENETVSECQK